MKVKMSAYNREAPTGKGRSEGIGVSRPISCPPGRQCGFRSKRTISGMRDSDLKGGRRRKSDGRLSLTPEQYPRHERTPRETAVAHETLLRGGGGEVTIMSLKGSILEAAILFAVVGFAARAIAQTCTSDKDCPQSYSCVASDVATQPAPACPPNADCAKLAIDGSAGQIYDHELVNRRPAARTQTAEPA